MGDYDKVIKENIEAIFLPLLEKFTGIQIVKSDEITDNQPAGGQESSRELNKLKFKQFPKPFCKAF